MIEVFFRLWTPLEKKRRPHRRGLTARSDQSLSPSANCCLSRFVVAKFNFRTINKRLEYLHAARECNEREQLVAAAEGCVCVGLELVRAISKPERLAILRSFRVRTEANRIPFLTKAKTKANYLCKPRLRALQLDSI